MLIYSASRAQFSEDVQQNRIAGLIEEAFLSKLSNQVTNSEFRSWSNSLEEMDRVLNLGNIVDDAGVAIEFQIPLTSKRVDFILSGRDVSNRDTAVIVELKQWEIVNSTMKPGIVKTVLGGNPEVETVHPSYQAWTYAAFIKDYNLEVQTTNIQIKPCAYLHNCFSSEGIKDDFYQEEIEKAPLFLGEDQSSLASFLGGLVRSGDDSQIVERIEHSKLRPSKHLIEYLASLLDGNEEFNLIDDQKLVYETALELANRANEKQKQVMLVHGGPGTGKSVLAINLLANLTKQEKVAQYVTRNVAPREVYKAKLTGTRKQTVIGNLFKSSGSYFQEPENKLDALIVDEAHRLSPKSGYRGMQGENQVKEIIRASNLSVFFIDEKQKIIWRDIGESEEIRRWALNYDATITEMNLPSQFRCNGSDSYLAWVDSVLQIEDSTVSTMKAVDYDFKVFDSPNKLKDKILELAHGDNQARLVAGFCWDWRGKDDPNIQDVVIEEHNFSMRWNLDEHGNRWIITPNSTSEIGCIYTCQGLELDYVGVIIGSDLIVRNGIVQTNARNRSKNDNSTRGFITALKENPTEALQKADKIIKNTYRTLMTRGLKGCYVFCVDEETNEYFKQSIG